MEHKKFLQSATFKKILFVIGILLSATVIFRAGERVGYSKALFSYRFGDNYIRAFGRPERGPMSGPRLFNPHGVSGKIIKVDLPTLVVEEQDKTEKIVSVSTSTVIRHFRDALNSSDLKPNDNIVVIGAPLESAAVEARLIRVIDTPANI